MLPRLRAAGDERWEFDQARSRPALDDLDREYDPLRAKLVNRS